MDCLDLAHWAGSFQGKFDAVKRSHQLLCSGLLATLLAYPIVAQANTKKAPAHDVALIVQAKSAFEKNRIAELERIAAKTKGHLLAAWPDYWILRARISGPQVQGHEVRQLVEKFSRRHADHPLAERAHQDLIDALAKRGLWEDVFIALKEVPHGLSSTQITCAKSKAELVRALDPASAAAAAQLAAGKETTDACLALVDYLAANAMVDSVYLRQRLRWSAQTAGPAMRSKMLDIFQAYTTGHDPEVRGPSPIVSERHLAETLQFTRSNSLQALQSFERYRKSWTHEQSHYAAFAVGAALWQRSHANAWPLILEGWPSLSQQPDLTLQMAAREAIRRYEWQRLIEIISAMSPTVQQESTWVYWKAIGLGETKGRHQAADLLKTLRHDYGFYGLLARERLGEPVLIPQPASVSAAKSELRKLDNHQGMQRSYALARAGLRAEAVQEWSAAIRGKSDTELLLAAHHAQEQGLIDRMIAAADRTKQEHDFRLRYPAPFKDNVLPAAQAQSIDPWWVLGLIRQESRFIPDIRSSVGATGLMQIMPATGKMLAKNSGLKNKGKLSLTDIDLNVQLGTRYLRQLQDKFDGSALLASAAYNAGPARAASWRSALPGPIDGAAFAESIPFSETRDYVKRVLTNAVLYHAVHNGGSAPSLKKLLGEIIPGQSS